MTTTASKAYPGSLMFSLNTEAGVIYLFIFGGGGIDGFFKMVTFTEKTLCAKLFLKKQQCLQPCAMNLRACCFFK